MSALESSKQAGMLTSSSSENRVFSYHPTETDHGFVYVKPFFFTCPPPPDKHTRGTTKRCNEYIGIGYRIEAYNFRRRVVKGTDF